ncbi:YuzD family protein [Mammaliicoccus sciuri]|uniref:YuzD family protein n=1 Tax=Mammaliicoccus sciuri TaxID=1296 RepID=UPI00046EE567|nr:YuzD family protein [Mammaliicoccus sciuri]MCD8799493.1 YuzD family protein [Mammaliicoccus sciuri]MCJ0912623.1 YuzD family protein [Mammaliicoccus sciuri]MCJ0967857.1 YuzD family protein [Mammaliicoccus sciuri]MEB5650036.1 YuzD family protein [Mammaliicoccus sciuri]MEB7065578.1 YuzD family protein [Mammaliicoccus sciuri]
MSKASIVIYGADVVCASCVNAPSSKDTFEWLQAILGRKYPELNLEYTYIDIMNQTENLTDHDQQFIERINEDELFYPLVTINDEYVADGYVQLKPVTKFIEEHVAVEQ